MTFLARYIRSLPALSLIPLIVILMWFTSAGVEPAEGREKAAKTVAVFHCDYAPVSFLDKNTNRPSGFFVDLLDGVAARAGLQVEYICKSGWPEMISAIESGEADLGILMRSEEREKSLLFSAPIEVSYLSFFARAQSSIDADRIPAGQTVGVVRGSMSWEQLKNRPGLRLQTQGTYQEGIFRLLAGKIDLFAGEESMILKTSREAGLDARIKKVGKPFAERERCLAVRRDNVQLRALLDKSLQGFVGSPEYQRIYLKWYGTPQPYWTVNRLFVAGGVFLFIVVCGMALWRYLSLFKINQDLIQQVNERRKAESDLELFKNLLNKSNDAIFINDPQTGRFIDVNERACAGLGYDRAELLNMEVRDIETKFPDDFVWQDHVTEVRRQGFLLVEGGLRRKDGTTFPVETNVSFVVLGAREYMIAVVRDITERKRSEAALRSRGKQLAESQRIAHVGSWEHNLTTGQVFWSDELFRLLGLDPKTDPGDFKMFFDMVHPDDQPALKKAIEESVQLGKPFSIEYRFVLRDGTIRMIHARAELIHDDTGTQNILSGTGQDITERKQAEEKIRRNEQFIRSILDTVDEGFNVIDREYRILTANKAYCAQAGLTCDEVIGKHCYEVSHRTDRPCHEDGEDCAVRQVFETGEPHTALHKHTDIDGHILYVETKGFPIKDDSGKVNSVIETINNITEKHLLEEERLKTQKLESIGTLAGGIAHDFNNLLQGVFGYISMAKITYDRKDRSLAMLEQAEKALHQAVNLTTQLLTFSKGGKPIKKLNDLRPVIENATKFTLSGSRSDFHINIPDDLWQAEADEGQVGQVIQNIVLNADQSMPMAGSVIVTAANVAEGNASLPPGLARGNYVIISIQDAGIGIPKQYVGKIFDPYFTTKEKGSGLGLATSYSIVRNHGGTIDVRTKPGEGSTFMIYLPAIAGKGRKASAARPAEPTVTRTTRVLVMDDEEIVRDLCAELLSALGHEVEVAKHGQEALTMYQGAMAAGKPFDIVILDLTVRGGMGGADAVQKLLQIDPAVKAIVSSGYSDDAAIANHEAHGFKACLKKPYDIAELRDVLISLMA